jgi:hypothetical protein
VLEKVRGWVDQQLQSRVARRHVEHELIALHGAVSHAVRVRDAALLASLPDTPQWDYYAPALGAGMTTRSLNLAPAYESYRHLRETAREATDAATAPSRKGPAGEPTRLWSLAETTRRELHDALSRVTPLAAQQGVRQAG